MRYFTTTLVVALCYLSPWAPMVAHADNIAERTLVGYSVPLSVRPGDTVEFKVSSFAGDY